MPARPPERRSVIGVVWSARTHATTAGVLIGLVGIAACALLDEGTTAVRVLAVLFVVLLTSAGLGLVARRPGRIAAVGDAVAEASLAATVLTMVLAALLMVSGIWDGGDGSGR